MERLGVEAREAEQPAAGSLLHSSQVLGDRNQGGIQLQLSPRHRWQSECGQICGLLRPNPGGPDRRQHVVGPRPLRSGSGATQLSAKGLDPCLSPHVDISS